MRAIILLTISSVLSAGVSLAKASEYRSLAEFEAAEKNKLGWKVVNDGVMGGLSRGEISFTKAGTM